MTFFRCRQSGNTISFVNPDDIESMRKEPHYEEIKDEAEETSTQELPIKTLAICEPEEAHVDEKVVPRPVITKVSKKRGRPAKNRL